MPIKAIASQAFEVCEKAVITVCGMTLQTVSAHCAAVVVAIKHKTDARIVFWVLFLLC